MARTAAKEHSITRNQHHFKWDNANPPVVEIEPGDIVHIDAEEVTAGQLKKGDPASKLGALDFDRLYPLGGPVYVKGAEPGDALEVEILELKPGSWGWSAAVASSSASVARISLISHSISRREPIRPAS